MSRPAYVLDTDTFTLYQHRVEPVTGRMLAAPQGVVAVGVVTVGEALSGWQAAVRRARTPEQEEIAYAALAETATALARFPLLLYDRAAIDRFEHLKRLKLNVGSDDLRIAATALVHQVAVVTRNRRDFQRVPGLQCEDWSAPPLAGPPPAA